MQFFSKNKRRIAILGIDGADPKLTGEFLKKGVLPFLAELKDKGAFDKLPTTHVSQSPVAWSSFMTGMNPGKHGVYDFIHRDPETMQIKLGLCEEKTGANGKTSYERIRQQQPVWKILGDQGIKAISCFIPVTFPPEPFNGWLTCGMGVPDLKGTQGLPCLYTTENVKEKDEVKKLLLENGKAQSFLEGPNSSRLPMSFNAVEGLVKISVDGKQLEVKENQWSDFLEAEFDLGEEKRKGVVRFKLIESNPGKLKLYCSPVMISPFNPFVPIAYPKSLSRELAEKTGVYKNNSFESDVHGLKEGLIDEKTFLEDMHFTLESRLAVAKYLLKKKPWKFFVANFFAVDRAQHVFWRYIDKKHPLYEESDYASEIEKAYQLMDEKVNELAKLMSKETDIFIMSDHGFSSYRYNVHINTALKEAGLLAVKESAEAMLLTQFDWNKTKAYAAGFSGVYINLAGREKFGLVSQEEYESTRKETINVLKKIKFKGQAVFEDVLVREAVYSGPFIDKLPDLVPLYAEGFRASRETALGMTPENKSLVEENKSKWCADHIGPQLPEKNAGIVFCSKPIELKKAGIMDLAPTVLKAFNTLIPLAMDGKPIENF